MCGRYMRKSDKQRLAEYFHLHGVPTFPLPPDFNVAPTTHQPVIRLHRETGEREMVLMRWGLVPHHAKSLAGYKGISTINARAENITAGLWKRLFQRHRCIVPADGFYEWKTLSSALSGPKSKAKPAKQPYAFSMADDAPFAFAGLWDAWLDPTTGEWLQSFAVITTEANELMASVHTRMPVILHRQDYTRWLDRSPDHQPPIDLLRSYESDAMRAALANPRVGNVRNNGPEMLEAPAEAPPNPADDPGLAQLPLNSG
jgi:putative SOS response-associated peptidase YedK